ncbi:MAG: M48 family metallopeptidase, partial [Burkholderiales bacterium]
LAAIAAGSLEIIARLSIGENELAMLLAGKRVPRGSGIDAERKLINVVDEMAIAAGLAAPPVYVLSRERGINAFAAGWDVSGAVVAVTRGTLETLTRDELQGVVAHEFSHILNGDMRLNVRMMGVLEGIVFLSSIGAFAMRSVSQSRGRKDSASGGIFVVGLALFIIGYVGLFFARIIKAAVSRQREFLADASSVQFTRNPDGLAGALDQIGLVPEGARIANRYAEEMAHMYFGQAISVWLGGLFDTHPPLEERIARVRPGFAPTRYRAARPQAEPQEEALDRREAATAVLTAAAALPSTDERRTGDKRASWERSAEQSAALVGQLEAGKMDYAARLLTALPEALRARLREPEGAPAAVISLLLAHKDELMHAQLDALKAKGLHSLA